MSPIPQAQSHYYGNETFYLLVFSLFFSKKIKPLNLEKVKCLLMISDNENATGLYVADQASTQTVSGKRYASNVRTSIILAKSFTNF